MKSTINILNDLIKEIDESPEAVGYDLRLDLADLVMANLKKKSWTQKQLADRCGMKPSFISRIIHAESNCTFEIAGRILHALNVKIELKSIRPITATTTTGPYTTTWSNEDYGQDNQEIIQKETSEEIGEIEQFICEIDRPERT